MICNVSHFYDFEATEIPKYMEKEELALFLKQLIQKPTSLLAEARVSLEQIMERLGHIDDQTTKNIYLHITKEMKKEASHKFAQLMRSFES